MCNCFDLAHLYSHFDFVDKLIAASTLYFPHAREMCLRFADLERKLGEIDRARAVYAHGSQISDPRVGQTSWKMKTHGHE